MFTSFPSPPPAKVGVYLSEYKKSPWSDLLPRTRGGLPPSGLRQPAAGLACPAEAGVYRFRRAGAPCYSRLPRMGGGLPVDFSASKIVHQITPHPLTEERTFQQTFELTKPKPRKTIKPNLRKPKARKPRVPTKTVEERIESSREYDRTRRQTDERKKFQRLYKQKVRQERKAAGQCRNCSNEAITGQTRCEVCRDKHRASR